MYRFDTRVFNQLRRFFLNLATGLDNDSVGLNRIEDILKRHTADDTVLQRFDNFFTIFEWSNTNTAHRTAIGFGDDHVLRHVNQTSRQITGVSRFQRGIGKTFAGTVRTDEILEHIQTFAEVRDNR